MHASAYIIKPSDFDAMQANDGVQRAAGDQPGEHR